MPTKCELIAEAKKKGIKGYSGLRKEQIQALLTYVPFKSPKKKKR